MASLSLEQLPKFVRGISVRQIRLGCGLVLFAYLVSHFLNHALGNVSMEALAGGVYYHTLFWQFLPVAIVFYTAALVHAGLGLWALYERRQFRWKAIEPLQLVLGLSIPALIITHVAGVRLGQTLFGHEKLYPQVLFAYWIVWPYKIWLMLAVMIISWVHGCIGLYFWLRMKAFYRSAAPFLLAAAVLVPTLAMLGLYQGGRSVVDSDSKEWRAENLSRQQVGTPAEQAVLNRIEDYFLIGYLGLLGFVLLARGVRALNERRGRHGQSVLWQRQDGSRAEGTQRARGQPAQQCPACQRVRRPRPLLHLPHSRDRRLRVAAGAFACARRSCSTASAPAPIRRSASPASSGRRPICPSSRSSCRRPRRRRCGASSPSRIGEERYLVSLFVDMRGSTKLAEKRLPFDTVFIVNRFLGAVSQAVIECGGQPNQFVGDGQLALFGLGVGPANRLPPGAEGRQHDLRQYRRIESIPQPRPARADPFRRRHSWRRGDHRRHRLSRSHGVHRARRCRQCRRAPAGHDQEFSPARLSFRKKFASPPALPTTACRSRKSRSAGAPSR